MSCPALRIVRLACLVLCFATGAFAQASGNSASFVGTDGSTQGNWRAKYGAEGYSIASSSQSLPSYDPILE
ncbi:MAG: hypothetical protein ABSE45_08670 [Candidatus Acidiferrales bacterium]|jgi:hypothetical protein